MIKVALAFDNISSLDRMGRFFESCAADFKIFLGKHENDLVEISGANLNYDSIHQTLSAFENRFVFVSFSHGKHDALICSHATPEYVSLTVNFSLFRESFFYTWSCLSSLALGEGLRSLHGCSVYWGHSSEVWAPYDATQQGIFIQCVNRGIEQFVMGKTVQEAKENAIEYYNEKIDELAEINYPLSSRLRINRDSMDVKGDMELTIADFQY